MSFTWKLHIAAGQLSQIVDALHLLSSLTYNCVTTLGRQDRHQAAAQEQLRPIAVSCWPAHMHRVWYQLP